MEEEEEIQPVIASEAEQFSWTVQGQIEACMDAARALSDGNGIRSY